MRITGTPASPREVVYVGARGGGAPVSLVVR
jgi:hypothetical protein